MCPNVNKSRKIFKSASHNLRTYLVAMSPISRYISCTFRRPAVKPLLIAFLSCFLCIASRSEEAPHPDSAGFAILPGKLLFTPLLANPQETRVGLRKEIGASRMRLDIGSSLDLATYSFDESGRHKLQFGIDFFMYALSVSSQGFRLQIDAADGFFGGHLTFRYLGQRNETNVRLRILHLSGHFLDGHFDRENNAWKDGRGPVPYTRDFGELTVAYTWPMASGSVRIYSGVAYATLIRPAEIGRVFSLHGIEFFTASLLGPTFSKPTNIYGAVNVTINGTQTVTGSTDLEWGIKVGEMGGSGVRLYGSYRNGRDEFSQYFDIRREYWGLGFAFDLW